ncbi:nucleoporin Nup37 [Drosophila grimshawi]|uniref:GH17354 n=1 Tax=Drosophila grimshawi TaxID=7222 RepID=B4JUV9_DROGR|nr:nucleoporin Nup37 [Drosophila grimshawi]EDV91279.1 GH17354 [Drosophila grimshawi]
MRTVTEPVDTIALTHNISCYEICTNDFAYNLICVAQWKHLSLITISLPEESGELMWSHLEDLQICEMETPGTDTRCHKIAFSPDTSLNAKPSKVTVCAAIGKCEIRLFQTDLNEKSDVISLNGHSDYVNDIAWVCDGELLASVSDDYTCRFWDITTDMQMGTTNIKNIITFCLSSAGMSIKSHPDEPNKVLVAEKRGIIHLYNVRSKQTVVSVESPKFPLMSADWAQSNRLFVTALAGGDIVTWDLSRPLKPADVKQVHEDGGRIVRFAPGSGEVAMASIGRPDLTLKVFVGKSTVPIIEAPLKTYGGLAWHQRLPYITAASDNKLSFWKVHVK